MFLPRLGRFFQTPAGIGLLLLGLIGCSPWDHRILYGLFVLVIWLMWEAWNKIRPSSLPPAIPFLCLFGLVAAITGYCIHHLQFSPLVRAMISGQEFMALGGIAGIGGAVIQLLGKNRIRAGLWLTAGLLLLWMSGPPRSYNLPAPVGPYAVGSRTLDWRDSTRAETLTRRPDDRRRLLVQFFYPAIHDPNAQTVTFKQLRRVQTNSELEVQAAETAPWPVIFYSAGLGGSRQDNLSQFEALASSGYLVVATSHPYFNTVEYPNGYRARAWSMDTLEGQGLGPAYIESVMHPIWEADVQSIYRLVQQLAGQPDSWLYQKVDFQRVGLMGWSLGGSAAVALCAKDARFHAGVNIDGFGWMPLHDSLKLSKPFLYFRSDMRDIGQMALFASRKDQTTIDSLDRRQSQREAFLFSGPKANGYSITYQEAYHSNYRDHGLLGISSLGPIDPHICNERLSRQVLGFFDQYLRNKDAAWWERDTAAVFRRRYQASE